MLVLSNTLGKEGGLLDVETLIERFMNIRTHPRARHKPLLLLLALSRVQHGESQFISYAALEPVLRRLLIEYGDLTSWNAPGIRSGGCKPTVSGRSRAQKTCRAEQETTLPPRPGFAGARQGRVSPTTCSALSSKTRTC